MMINPFLNPERQLRDGWPILIFFLVLAGLLVPAMLLAQQNQTDVSIAIQAVIIILATLISQLLRRKPLVEVLGKLSLNWLKELCLGGLFRSTLMLIPALILAMFGWMTWQLYPEGFSILASSLLLFAGVAVTEELLFRGFVFQRLISGLGVWPAQLIIAAFFLLTHLSNPGMIGSTKLVASINIFLASILFGVAFLRTRSLALHLGFHWVANWVLGSVLGFGVSGTEQLGILKPVFGGAPSWLTGGQFGLEASVPGFICVVATLIFINNRKPVVENLKLTMNSQAKINKRVTCK
jgi:uncharacterized protein